MEDTLIKPVRQVVPAPFEIKSTRNYNKFRLLGANRLVNKGHVELIKDEIKANPHLVKAQPVIVNERMEIIDGQHRFLAMQELGMRVPYVVVPGMSVYDARRMNVVQRKWDTDDYSRSYALSGDKNYQRYLKLREDYGFPHSITLESIYGTKNHKIYAQFRSGELSLTEEQDQVARVRLDNLTDCAEITPYARHKEFARAFYKVISHPDYDHNRMLKKLKLYGDSVLRNFRDETEYGRALDEIYNLRQGESNRVRIY